MMEPIEEDELAAIDEWARLGDFAGCPTDVRRLVAEVRRLRAELYNWEHTRTVSTAPVIGPEAAR